MLCPDIQGSIGPPVGEFIEALRKAKSIGCSVWFIEGSKNLINAKIVNTDMKMISETSMFFHNEDFVDLKDEMYVLLKISVNMNNVVIKYNVN